MSVLALSAAVGASISWAAGAMIAHQPARRLGAFEFTRTQLVSASALLALAVTATGAWGSIDWRYWPGFVASSLIGVVLGNLAMAACLRCGGPRRMQLLTSMSAPIAAVLGHVVLGEAIAPRWLAGAALVLAGIGLAIFHGHGAAAGPEPLNGSLGRVVALGLLAAACRAVGLIAVKPALLAGTDPLAASTLRTAGGALAITLVALWPAPAFEPASRRTGGLVLRAILPGVLGYVVAVSLLLFALRSYETGLVALLGSLSPVIMLPMIWVATGRRPPWPAWVGAGLVIVGTGGLLLG